MHKRYTKAAFLELWSEESKLQFWLKVELAYLEARVKFGSLTSEAYEAIKASAKIDIARMEVLEAEFAHDMIAFVVMVQESITAAGHGRYASEFHKYLTSYDTEDPALILMLREAFKLILGECEELEKSLRKKALEHQWTMMIARTHGQYAEPTTFGHLLLTYAEAIRRSKERLLHIEQTELSEGKISGAVGNYCGQNPKLEQIALSILGLRPARAETQILQRDRHAAVLNAITTLGATIEQISRTFWEMMRSEIRELEEPRKANQRGSSRMSYKKNPIGTEQLQGLPRLLRGYALASVEGIATPDCRDISQSSVERHTLPGATALIHYMLIRQRSIVDGLVVNKERMERNLNRTYEVWAAQPVRDALMDAGLEYNVAYTYTQKGGFLAVDKEMSFRDIMSHLAISESDPRTAKDIIGNDRFRSLFDAMEYVRPGIEHLFRS